MLKITKFEICQILKILERILLSLFYIVHSKNAHRSERDNYLNKSLTCLTVLLGEESSSQTSSSSEELERFSKKKYSS